METNKAEKKRFVLPRLFGVMFKIAPLFICFIFFLGIIQSISRVWVIFQTQKLFEKVSLLVGDESTLNMVVMHAVLLCFIMIISQLLNGTQNFLYDVFIGKMNLGLGKIYNQIQSALPPIYFENASNLEKLNKVKNGKDASIEAMLSFGDIFTYYLPYFIFVEVYLFSIKKEFAVFLFLIFIPVFVTQMIKSRFYADLENRSAPLRRRMEHYSDCISNTRYAKETIALGAVSYFIRKYKDVLKSWNKEMTGTGIKAALVEFALSLFTLGGYIAAILMLCRALFYQEISIAEFAAIYMAMSTVFSTMEEVIQYSVNSLSENHAKLQCFMEFICSAHKKTIPYYDYSECVHMSHISFSYPGSRHKALDDISIDIHKNECVAVVGENGSGKSTLIKMILGLYEPDQGKAAMRKQKENEATAVFQDYQRYKMTLDENVHISDVNSKKDTLASLEQAGVDASVLNEREQMLGVEFGGKDLSGGQWQRVAIARAIYKRYNFIAMDEPTSAIDAMEEDFLYEKFKEMIDGKTAVIVTHRLGFVKNADRIIVLRNGKITEQGTHNELMHNRGYYHNMYSAQADNYKS